LSVDHQVAESKSQTVKGRTQADGSENQGGTQMLASADKVRQTVEQSARIMDEYKQRLSEVLEGEVEGIRQGAEQEASAILAEAREAAQQITSQAKQEAEEQAVAYRAEMKRKAEEEAAAYMVSTAETADHQAAQVVAGAKQKAEAQARNRSHNRQS
jgi:23S rRNA pseudoU1915 N3-methylase RlmH